MRCLMIILVMWLPVVAMAERVVVRSGEHADFSRLAFEFEGAVEWEMGRVAQGYEIRVNRPGAVFDISDVFRRISHDRIQSLTVSKDNTRITLVMGCECNADAFEFKPGLLVVDVKDGLPDGASRFESALTSDEISTEQPVETEVQDEVEVVDNPLVATVAPDKEQLARLAQYLQHPNVPKTGNMAVSDIALPQPRAERVAGMQSEMLRQIGRAASQGLLDAKLSQMIQAPAEVSEPKPATIQEPQVQPQPHVNIHIESSVDRAVTDLLPEKGLTSDGAKCLPDQAFNVAQWGNPDSVIEQIRAQRGKITGEFDKADQQTVEALVKAYIYAGFGAEAQSVLSAFDVTLKDAAILKAMAQIVDGTPIGQAALFQGQAGCDTSAALWAALAAPELSKATGGNQATVLRAFSSLPFHLRKHLGPRLAKKFLDIDDIETARALRNVIARTPENAGPEFRLLEARLDQERGLHNVAEQTLTDIVSENSSTTPVGLIELLEIKLAQNSEIDEDLLINAESYIFEQQGTVLGANLKRVVALARAQSGDYFGALDHLRGIGASEHLDKVVIGQTWGRVLEIANSNAADEALLRFVFAAQDDLGHQNIPRNIRRQIAARLLDNGLPKMAQKLLMASASPTADDRILLARAAIIANEAARAIAILEPVSGEKAAILRATAYEDWGKQSQAGHEYGLMSDREKQMQAYWRAGDWQRLGDLGSDTEMAAAKIMTGQPQTDDQIAPAPEHIIAQDEALIGASKATRHTIEMLLEENPTPAQGKS